MNQRGVILAVVAVGLVSAALWYWHGSAEQPAAPKGTASLQGAFHGSATGPSPWPAPSSQTTVSADAVPAPAAAPEVAPPPASTPPETPQSVDTPEPAQRKFARGAKPDEPQQN